MRFTEVWRAARIDPGDGELTLRVWGDYDRHHIQHGWWVSPSSWTFGIGLDSDWSGRYEGRRYITIGIGPFAWCVSLCQPIRPVRGSA